MVLGYVASRLPVVRADGCQTQRSFYALRRGMRAAGIGGVDLRPGTPISALADRDGWPVLWTRARLRAGEPHWPASISWSGRWSQGPSTLGALARELAAAAPRPSGAPWTRERIEFTIREVVRDSAGVTEFSLDDEFARDLKIN